MKEYTTESIRNIALASHSSAGKTLLTEAFLHFTGATTRMGKIEDGTTVSDFDEEEVRRGISIYTSVIPVEYKGNKINVLDTPGYTDFVGEMISALRVADSAVILVDSVAGLEVGTELAWDYCNTYKLPRFLVINKMERENANFQKVLASVENFTDIRLIPVQLPWGEKAAFQGVIDLLSMKALKGDGKTVVDIPAEFKDAAEEAHMKLVEAAAEGDDSLLEKYLESGELSAEEILSGLKQVVRSCNYVPVFVAAGGAEIGIQPLLDGIITLLPSPSEAPAVQATNAKGETEEVKASDSGPLAAYVWKTTADPFVGKQTFFRIYSGTLNSDSRVWNQTKSIEERLGTLSIPRGKEGLPIKVVHAGDLCYIPKLSETSTGNTICDKAHPLILPAPNYPTALYQVAVNPKTQADSTKISSALTRLCEEDMTLSWHMEPSTNQTILQGMGDQHIDVAVRRATSKFQVGLTMLEPKVPYKETITKKGQAMYRHKKQTGGSGQFGEVHLRVEPSEQPFEFTWDVFGGAISQNYSSSIQKGIQAVMKEGILAGFPISGVHVSVFDGKEHPVDSKPIAFEIAGREAFKLAYMDSNPVLYEPIMDIRVIVPEENMGDILGDLNTRRARVQGMETEKGRSIVSAQVPLSEMLRYTTTLRSLTGGRGIFSMELARYDVVPRNVQEEIVADRQKELAASKEKE
ncbi:translation elongation factor 2 [Longilinea arvoryzae]|uniref:Translation elongation factor 2 n=1 Tax=Longilinea arvoryzae TaxID=360412 RepID=A0A0S7BBR1_9CHLR|nr:elongation factor G [Longilinea arvoryzae]GAP15260.1 translation elongation factor 2 [Longilinea arvoryzae]